MNRQPNANRNDIRSLTRTASYLSTKEIAMNRRIVTVLFTLFAVLVLSACAVQSPFQGESVFTAPKAFAAAETTGPQINNRQELAEYQATLPVYIAKTIAPETVTKVDSLQINDRQDLAEYQASLPVYAAKTTVYTGVQQIHDRQELAEYQATLR